LKFRKFFLRGLAFILPTILTIALLLYVYRFVQNQIAAPINSGVQELLVRYAEYPQITEQDIVDHEAQVGPGVVDDWKKSGDYRNVRQLETRRVAMEKLWNSYAFPLDLIGLLIAILLIYIIGLVVGSYIGRQLYRRGEKLVRKVPLVKQVYPSIKQITDFFFDDEQIQFSRVVAVEYPRKGMWSLGLVTGTPMTVVVERSQSPCLTIFVPSSPTPFTGYVITVPRADTIDLPISIEEALRFTVSGGVVVPEKLILQSEREAAGKELK